MKTKTCESEKSIPLGGSDQIGKVCVPPERPLRLEVFKIKLQFVEYAQGLSGTT